MSEPRSEWASVECVLERYFLARERGDPVDVIAICGGNEQLAQRVSVALKSAPDLVVGGGDASDDGPPMSSFGDFDILGQIGRGGMGTVYLARQRSLGRDVALKVLSRSACEDAGARLRLRREAELTAHLEHANIHQRGGAVQTPIWMYA